MSAHLSSLDVASSADPAAQLRSLQLRLEAMQREHDRYKTHYGELESVCWELVKDMQELRGEGLNDSHNTVHTLRGAATSTTATEAERRVVEMMREALPRSSDVSNNRNDLSSSSAVQKNAVPLAPSPGTSPLTDVRSQPSGLRVRGSVLLSRSEAQALVNRLWTLREWVSDLGGGDDGGVSLPPLGAEYSDLVASHTHLDSAVASRDATVEKDAAQHKVSLSATVVSSPSLSSPSRPQQRVHDDSARLLHRIVDDVFLSFTQLQATLTDTRWPISHPPALSTPARTRLDRDVEVARLRTINEQLRRTLRGYEQSHSRTAVRRQSAEMREVAARTQRRPSAPPPPPPPPPAGYKSAAADAGLFVAHARR